MSMTTNCTTWLPIDSAPKDGTKVDLWSDVHGRITDSYYSHREDGWVMWSLDIWGRITEDLIGNSQITHWLPLPPPPETELAP